MTAPRWGPGAMVILAAGLCFLACTESPPSPDTVARSVLGETSRAQLDAFILALPADQRRPEAGENLAQWRQRQLEDLLVERALEAEARSLGLDSTPPGKDRIRERRDKMLVEFMRSELIRQRVRIGDDQVAAYYRDHAEEFEHVGEVRLRNIFRRVKRDAPAEQRQAVRAATEALRQRLLDGADFGDLARTSSDSETASRGGLIGEVARGSLDGSIEQIVRSLGEGEISQVVATAVGFHIFKVDRYLPPSRSDLDEVRGRIRARLRATETARLLTQVRDELVAEFAASYQPQALDRTWSTSQAEILGFPDPGAAANDLSVAEFRRLWQQRTFRKQRENSLDEQMEELVTERLLLAKAAKLGFTERPEFDRLEQHELVEMAYQRRLRQWLSELDEEVLRRAWDDAQDRFRTPQLTHLHLLTRSFGDQWQPYTVYEETQRLASEIRAGRSFADVARQASDDPSAAAGGDLGWIRLDEFLQWAGPKAAKVLDELPVGEVSAPILTIAGDREARLRRTGYMLVLIAGVREPELRPFEEVRVQVENWYLDTWGEAARLQIRAQIIDSLDLTVFAENL